MSDIIPQALYDGSLRRGLCTARARRQQIALQLREAINGHQQFLTEGRYGVHPEDRLPAILWSYDYPFRRRYVDSDAGDSWTKLHIISTCLEKVISTLQEAQQRVRISLSCYLRGLGVQYNVDRSYINKLDDRNCNDIALLHAELTFFYCKIKQNETTMEREHSRAIMCLLEKLCGIHKKSGAGGSFSEVVRTRWYEYHHSLEHQSVTAEFEAAERKLHDAKRTIQGQPDWLLAWHGKCPLCPRRIEREYYSVRVCRKCAEKGRVNRTEWPKQLGTT
ncbi:hypothetical protein CLAFUW4_11624 [Fulvia fulva]|nr:hypothetical protein CLAFUR4_11629 [Fulvia fulva]WPV17650.1 hypothetical protein CLAFUW4_11624 [Fulvia fulva]